MIKAPTYQERVGKALLENPHGLTGLELSFKLNIISPRNEVNEIEKVITGLRFQRTAEKNEGNHCNHLRYAVANRQDAEKLLSFINSKAIARGGEPINEQEAETLLSQFKDNA